MTFIGKDQKKIRKKSAVTAVFFHFKQICAQILQRLVWYDVHRSEEKSMIGKEV